MRALALALTLAAFLACDESPTSPSDLRGSTWRLVSIERTGAATIAVQDPSRYTIRFEDGERVSVRADCNSCGGTYVLAGATLSIGALACTRAFCGEASLDGEFTQALGRARSLATTGNELTIRGDGPLLRFRN